MLYLAEGANLWGMYGMKDKGMHSVTVAKFDKMVPCLVCFLCDVAETCRVIWRVPKSGQVMVSERFCTLNVSQDVCVCV